MRLIFILISWSLACNLNGQVDWELKKHEKDIKVWTKDYPDSAFKRFKAETTIKASLKNVVAVFLDIENMGEWYDRVASVDLVEKISWQEGIYKINFELPWPVADRESAVRAKISHDQLTNTVHVITNYEPNVITDPKEVLVTNMSSKWSLTPIGDDHIYIYHEGYMDPNGSLPAWIANTGVTEGPIKTLVALKEILPQYMGKEVSFLK